MNMNLIICGSRDFGNHKKLFDFCNSMVVNYDEVTVFCGGCRGADYWGMEWAKSRGFKVRKFPADWDKLKMRAGPIRNSEMLKEATHLIAFWNGHSPGTYDIIKKARAKKLPLRVIVIG